MEKKTVTVVIPALNEEKFIQRCLDSLRHLNYPKDLLKIVLADNGSQDKTVEVALSNSAVVVNVPRQSIGHTRNVGASDSTTDLIAFIDADIVVHPDWLKNAISYFANEEVVAVGSYPDVIQEESNRLQRLWSDLCRNRSKDSVDVAWLPSANLIVRRSVFAKVSGFNEKLITCEDVDLGYRMKSLGKIIHAPEILVYHLREPGTFGEFFKKEVWHSMGNMAGAVNHGVSLTELPSLALPGIFGAAVVTCAMGLFLGLEVFSVGCLLAFLPVCLYVLKRRHKVGDIGFVFCIYTIYLAARSVSFYREVLGFILSKKNK